MSDDDEPKHDHKYVYDQFRSISSRSSKRDAIWDFEDLEEKEQLLFISKYGKPCLNRSTMYCCRGWKLIGEPHESD